LAGFQAAEVGVLYQPPYLAIIFVHSLVAIDRIVSGSPTSAFHASQQA